MAEVSLPLAPSLVEAVGEPGRIALSWQAGDSAAVLGYNVYRSTQADQGYQRLVSEGDTLFTTAQPKYVDAAVQGGVVYFYRISAVAAQGEGALSEPIEVQSGAPDLPGLPDLMAGEEPGVEPQPPPAAAGGSAVALPRDYWQEESRVRRQGFFTGRALLGVGFLGASLVLADKGRDYRQKADEFYRRYQEATEPAEIERLYQRTTNRDAKSQVSWALGAACALNGLRLLLTRQTEVRDDRSSLQLIPRIEGRRVGVEVGWR